jgi:potassium channel subfamily K
LIAATTAPLSNILSIAALVTTWRVNLYGQLHDYQSTPIPDPHWAYGLNAASLACGFLGNAFLTLNFAKRVRYIVALPVTILLWLAASILLTTALAEMNLHASPMRPEQTYSQGYFYGIISAVLYLFSCLILMANMIGCFMGKYHSDFIITDSQRTLLLQTRLFFFWMAGGAAIFARVNGWSYVDSLYFCDVSILTVGFGDFFPTEDTGRGLIFPFTVGGIVSILTYVPANTIDHAWFDGWKYSYVCHRVEP